MPDGSRNRRSQLGVPSRHFDRRTGGLAARERRYGPGNHAWCLGHSRHKALFIPQEVLTMNSVAAIQSQDRDDREQPAYLAARMVNEFAYCPRLFYYEHVMGVFVHNEYTAEGAAQHKRVDREGKGAPKPAETTEEPVVVRSITLSSEEYRVIAKLDLAEFQGACATPVDYKRGRPMRDDDGLGAWPSDRVQLAVQAMVLRANGYECEEGVIFYQQTRQRVRVEFDKVVMEEAKAAMEGAWATSASTEIPPPLVDSPNVLDAPWWESACLTRRFT